MSGTLKYKHSKLTIADTGPGNRLGMVIKSVFKQTSTIHIAPSIRESTNITDNLASSTLRRGRLTAASILRHYTSKGPFQNLGASGD